MTDPRAYLRRTPLRAFKDFAGAQWAALGDAAVVERVADAGTPPLMIADFSPLPRLGFKGRGTMAAMQKRGLAVQPTPNIAYRQDDGSLCLVLGANEVFLLSNVDGDGRKFEEWEGGWSIDDAEGTYPLLRRDSHAWFVVKGPRAAEMFAKICGVDLRPAKFPDLSIAQTMIARMSAVVVRADIDGALCFHMLVDSAAALYFSEAILDAAQELGGRVVGRSEIRGGNGNGEGKQEGQSRGGES